MKPHSICRLQSGKALVVKHRHVTRLWSLLHLLPLLSGGRVIPTSHKRCRNTLFQAAHTDTNTVKPGRTGKWFCWGAKQGCDEPLIPPPLGLSVLRKGFLHQPVLAPLVGQAIQPSAPCASILAIGHIFPRDAHTASHSLAFFKSCFVMFVL